MWSSTCFGRHTAHHQEPKTALASSGFSYVEGCWTLSGTYCALQRPTTRPTTFHIWKIRGSQCRFRLLMMGGVSPETCWASYKYGIITFWYIVASCWIFRYELYYDARIYQHQVQKRNICCIEVCSFILHNFSSFGSPAVVFVKGKLSVRGFEGCQVLWSPDMLCVY